MQSTKLFSSKGSFNTSSVLQVDLFTTSSHWKIKFAQTAIWYMSYNNNQQRRSFQKKNDNSKLYLWLPFEMEIVRIFHSGYYECRGAFQTVLDSYCCVTG